MAAFAFFKPTSPRGSSTRIRTFPAKQSPATGWLYGNPVVTASGLIDIAATNPSQASLVGIALTQSKDVNGVQPGGTGYGGAKLFPVAVKTMEDEWVTHNWSTAGGGTLNTPTVASVVGVQAGIFLGALTTSATDIRGAAVSAGTDFAVDTNLTVHFEGVRVLDSLFRDITISGGTGEYVVVRWLNVAQ